MKRVFADSFYFFAILNPTDHAHERALEWARQHDEPIVTTAWVLTELADGLASTAHRGTFSRLVARLQEDPEAEVVPPTEDMMARGTVLYDPSPTGSRSGDRPRYPCPGLVSPRRSAAVPIACNVDRGLPGNRGGTARPRQLL